ncbi:MAG: hypothetical protein FWF91_04360 [Coriobacteriia bacterium]|nr:hypothetical protein [Coriobacteriia bacterium]
MAIYGSGQGSVTLTQRTDSHYDKGDGPFCHNMTKGTVPFVMPFVMKPGVTEASPG